MAQINAIVGDLEGNTRKICEAIEAAAEKGADLIAFPELALTGYPPEDLLLTPDFVAANREALLEVARHTPAVSVVVGFVDADDHLYNAAALLYDGRVAGIYHKHRLPNYGVFDEKRYFQPGAECPLFALDNAPIAVTVCEDVWAPGGPPQAAARAGALLLININASPYHAGKWRQREEMLRTRARDYAATIAYVNLVGGQDELVFDGMSLVVDHLGTVVARGPQFQEGLVYCDVDLEAVQQARRANGVPAAGAPLEEKIATPTIPGRPEDVTEENIQARIRGTLLMALSNKFGWLVLTTGNKSEMSVGYATLYGDMAGGFAVIKDVPKTMVYELCRWKNRRGEVFPE